MKNLSFLQRCVVILLSIFMVLAGGNWADAQNYPTRPITMIVPYPPGGGADLGSKTVAEKISLILGQPIISTYKPGAGGGLGAALAAKAKPDGYTLLGGASESPVLLGPMTKKDLGYSLDDFILVGGYSKLPVSINVKSGGPWKTLPEFIADAKKNPGKYRYGTYGALSLAHFVMELLCKQAGIKMIHIPFPGSPQANTALLGDHVELACTTGTGGLHQAGSLKIIAIAEPKRLLEMKDVPTLTELGYPINLGANYSYAFPKGIPQEIVNKFYEALKKAFTEHEKEIAVALGKVEQYPGFMEPQEIRELYNREMKLLQETAKDLGVI